MFSPDVLILQAACCFLTLCGLEQGLRLSNVIWDQFRKKKKKNLKSSSDLKYGKDNGYHGLNELKSISRLKIFRETEP